MIENIKYKNTLWVNAENPSKEEIRGLMDKFNLHPDIAEDFISETDRPWIKSYKEVVYVVLHFPAFKHSNSHRHQEIDFVIGKDFIITNRYEVIDPLHKFAKILETTKVLEKETLDDSPILLFFLMLKKLYKAQIHEIEYIEDRLKSIREEIDTGEHKKVVFKITDINKDLIDLRHTIIYHEDILKVLEEDIKAVFKKVDFREYSNELIQDYKRIQRLIKNNEEMMLALRKTNDSLLEIKQNEVMKALTIVAVATLPISFIAAIFSMNTKQKLIIGMPNDFIIIVFLMFVTTATIFLFAKYKKWF